MDGFLNLNVKASVFYFKNLLVEITFWVYIILAIHFGVIFQQYSERESKADKPHQQ